MSGKVVHFEIPADDVERASSLGGQVVRGKEPVGDMGFAAYFTDTEGNLMGLWADRLRLRARAGP
ncbi:MAG TPA: hypothetical protein VM386_00735 [Acidimicrobiales bacterium]|nr:hypothetical protein [Acidimicrobiales bacterium]